MGLELFRLRICDIYQSEIYRNKVGFEKKINTFEKKINLPLLSFQKREMKSGGGIIICEVTALITC